MINPAVAMKLMNAQNKFTKNHPKFMAFFKTVLASGMPEGSIIEITVTKPGEAPITANMRVTREDLEMVESLKDLAKNDN